jgi:hypothetical protein
LAGLADPILTAVNDNSQFRDRSRMPYFDIPAASPPVIPGAPIVLAMTLGYTAMDRLLVNKKPKAVATTQHLCGGPTGLPVTESIASKD